MNRRYVFEHVFNGEKTGLVNKERTDLISDAMASYVAIEIARGLPAKGLEKGQIVVTGSWAARDFTYAVNIMDAPNLVHTYDEISREPLPGYDVISQIIAELWPWEEPRPVTSHMITETIWNGRVTLELSRPRGNLMQLSLQGSDLTVEAYHSAPSLFVFLARWPTLTSDEALQIWQEAVDKVAEIRERYIPSE